jgi:hypothetical protein
VNKTEGWDLRRKLCLTPIYMRPILPSHQSRPISAARQVHPGESAFRADVQCAAATVAVLVLVHAFRMLITEAAQCEDD